MVFERITTTLENTLSYTGSSIRNFEHGLAMHLVQYKDQLHPIVYDHDITIYNDIVRACDLVQQLQQITDSTHAEQVALLLRRYLKYISQYRSIGIRGLSLLRLYVRYFARELPSHLLYWSWKELFSLEKQSLPIDEAVYRQTMDAYFDMYVAFALLEERIEGRIPACEGLLIVRERKEEYQRPVIAAL